ncbi:MAG TPA: hypothetical protein VG937_11390 [Polyangiaceae bacterium]|nr:hypothetical protein [Polyangiaceae bacterium]
MRSCVAGAVTLCALSLGARAETAPPRSSALNWVRRPGAESCPSAFEIARQIDERLGRRVFSSPSNAELFVEAWVERRDAPAVAWLASITVYSANGSATGQRQLESDEMSCTKLGEAAVLAIALMVDPEAVERAEVPGPSPKREREGDAAGSPDPESAARDASRTKDSKTEPAPVVLWPRPAETITRPALRAQLTAGANFVTSLLPGPALGASLRARARPPSAAFGIELSAAYYFESTREFSAGKGGRFNVAYLGVAPCWTLSRPAFIEPWLCAGAQAGVFNVTGYGFQESVSVQRSWLVNGAFEAHALLHVSRHWAASLSAGLLVPFWRETFEVTVGAERKRLFRPSALAELLALGVVYDW